jgi:hypothetical protein
MAPKRHLTLVADLGEPEPVATRVSAMPMILPNGRRALRVVFWGDDDGVITAVSLQLNAIPGMFEVVAGECGFRTTWLTSGETKQ